MKINTKKYSFNRDDLRDTLISIFREKEKEGIILTGLSVTKAMKFPSPCVAISFSMLNPDPELASILTIQSVIGETCSLIGLERSEVVNYKVVNYNLNGSMYAPHILELRFNFRQVDEERLIRFLKLVKI